MSQDQLICSGLEEKLQIYTELHALNGRAEPPVVEPRLLVQPHPEDPPQAAVLLAAALQEGETSLTLSPHKPDKPQLLLTWLHTLFFLLFFQLKT